MFKFLKSLIFDELGGLGCVYASIVSAVAEKTGDSSSDAATKIGRLINEVGPNFCGITNFPFLRSNISFSITNAAYTYSGASYLPTTFKRVVSAYILDGSERYPLNEVGIQEAYRWPNPNDFQGIPEEFCITRVESGYWEIQFNKLPSQTYTVYMDVELQWADVTSGEETLITKDFYGCFCHFVSLSRFMQQGDTENYTLAERQWERFHFPNIFRILGKPLQRKRIKMAPSYMKPLQREHGDYGKRIY